MNINEMTSKYWLPIQRWGVLVVTIVGAVMAAKLTWVVVTPMPSVVASKIIPASQSDNSTSQGISWSQVSESVASRDFFGAVEAQVAPTQEVDVDAPDTSLSLTLLAILAQGSGGGFAIISEKKGSGKVFGVGENLFGQAELLGVYGDRVTLNHNGRTEVLRYEHLKSNDILQQVGQAGVSHSSGLENSSSFQEALSQANKEVSNGADLQSQVQGVLGYVSKRANEDPEAFLKEMGLEVTGDGYQVGRRARQLQMIGLRPGDVVTAINDSSVGNIQSDQILLNQIIQTGGELKIQIRRGSRSFTIYQSIPTL